MIDMNEDKQHKALIAAIERLHKPLEVLAFLKLAEELYSKEERTKVYAEYEKLHNADQVAYKNLMQIQAAGDALSWEQRVEKYGEAKAKEQLAPHMAARDLRKNTRHALILFEDQHRVVLRLLYARDTFGKRGID
jgi:hypothetical protein